MPNIVELLPDHIANQIAAGEVIQRPASVVKELLENAVDAESTQIQVIIKNAGKTLIQIIDNGKGMSETDARMSIERHATSKIKTSDDLFKIKTMGFRGEALASIAAIAQLEIKTKESNQELGTLLIVEGSEVNRHEPIAHPQGTSISVKNLFFNVPARRNFLKSNAVEMRHILDEFQRVALAHPEISFSLYQNDLEIYQLPKGKLSQRIIHLFGKNYQQQLAFCKESTDHIKIEGYIGKPEFAKKKRGEQFFFINKRFIKSNYLGHAVKSAYENLIQDDAYPFYVLMIEMDPAKIDINVHPTKTEVKFEDEYMVYGIIKAAVRQALGTHNITPSLDFNQDVNFLIPRNTSSNKDTNYSSKSFSTFSKPKKEDIEGLEELYTSLKQSKLNFDTDQEEPQTVTFQSAANELSFDEKGPLIDISKKELAFQLHNMYIIIQVKSGMLLIDQHAAHKRILFEKYMNMLNKKNGIAQQSLFPQTITLDFADYTLLIELQKQMEDLGFILRPFGKNTVIIEGVPIDATNIEEKTLIEGILEQFRTQKELNSNKKNETLAQTIAQKAAIKPGLPLKKEELIQIIDQLFACTYPNYSPDGMPTFEILELEKIKGFFKK